MIRSVLVPLDGSDSSLEASRLALRLATRHHAHAVGLGIMTSAWIQEPQSVPIGGAAINAALDLSLIQDPRARIEAVLERFRTEAVNSGTASYDIRTAEGDALHEVAQAAISHDLVVLGRNSLFDVGGELYDFPICVEKIIRQESRPVLLVPDTSRQNTENRNEQTVLVAFDGSAASSRCLHMFALLGLAEGKDVHVLTVAEEAEVAKRAAERASQILSRHGASKAHVIGLGDREAGTPSEMILGVSQSICAGIVVMGAYGRRGIREVFGSTTREVLEGCPVPLFFHH